MLILYVEHNTACINHLSERNVQDEVPDSYSLRSEDVLQMLTFPLH